MAAITDFGARLREKYDSARAARLMIEQRWLQSLRQYRGVYDPEILCNIPADRSQAYIRLTRTKVKTMDARLMDMMFPAGGAKNWAIEVEETAQGFLSHSPAGTPPLALVRPGVAGAPQQPASDQDHEDAERRADAMEAEIARQLDECGYRNICREVIHSGNLYGTGILKGPLVERHNIGSWQAGVDGAHVYVEADAVGPCLEFVPLWDVYPDLAARSLAEAEYVFQRHVMLRSDLRKLSAREGFDAAGIEQYIRDHPDGDVQPQSYDVELRAIGDNETQPLTQGPRFEVAEYWGYVDAQDLLDCGCELPDDTPDGAPVMEFEANVWMLGQRVIKAALNPFDARLRPYHFYYFERDEVSVFGVGVADILRDTNRVFNAAVRAAIDNAAISAGPMIEVNQSLLAEGEDPFAVAPFRVYVRKGTSSEANAPAVRSYMVANNSAALLNLAEVFKQYGDEASAIPAYVHGENGQGVARTVGGLSMLMGAANITLKDTAGHYDDGITRPVIRAMYHWNMQFSGRQDIQGNYRIVTQGADSLVAKEIRARQLEALASATDNPVDAPFINREALMRERVRANELNADALLKNGEEVRREMQARSAQPDPDMLKIETDRQKIAANSQIEGAKLALKSQQLDLARREDEFNSYMAAQQAELAARADALDRAERAREANLRWGGQ